MTVARADRRGGRAAARASTIPPSRAPFDRFADARVVLLGEASHGTSEFYRARAAITRRLIERHGFTIVAVEADWPDAASIDRYVRHRPRREGEEAAFERFPTWMWRNTEVDAFVRWLRGHNEGRPHEAMTGFYGLDLYNLGALDPGRDRLSRRSRSRGGEGGARALRLPQALGARPGRLRPAGRHPGLRLLRGRRRSRCSGS